MSKVLMVKIKAIQDASYNVPSIKITKLHRVDLITEKISFFLFKNFE